MTKALSIYITGFLLFIAYINGKAQVNEIKKELSFFGNKQLSHYLKDPLSVKRLSFSDYKSSTFPDDTILKFTNLETLVIFGGLNFDPADKSKTPVNTKIKIDTIRLRQLTHLKHLSFTYIDLVDLNDIFPSLRQLYGLSIVYSDIDTLPEQIVQLKQLKVLDLSNNKLSELGDSITGLDKLMDINLANNAFKLLPPQLSKLRSIQTVNISNDENLDKKASGNMINYKWATKRLTDLLELPDLKSLRIMVKDQDEKDDVIYNINNSKLSGKIFWDQKDE